MGSAEGPATPGAPLRISARQWNDIRAQARQAIAEAAKSGPAVSLPRSTDCVAVYNVSGVTLPMFGIVGFHGGSPSSARGPVIAPSVNLPEFQGRPVLKCRKPLRGEYGGKNDIGRFGIVLQPIKNGWFGLAQVAGVATCKIDVEYEGHVYADVKNANADELKSHECGAAEILWKESGTGSGKWAIVRLGQFITPPLVGKFIDDPGTTSPIDTEIAYVLNDGSTVDTGRHVDARLSYGVIETPYTSNSPSAGHYAHLRYDRVADQFCAVAPLYSYYPITAFDPTA